MRAESLASGIPPCTHGESGPSLPRWVGYIAATIAAVSAMAWMPYYPVWSLTYVGIAVLVFYALAQHGARQPA